jgi:hypothetical protein
MGLKFSTGRTNNYLQERPAIPFGESLSGILELWPDGSFPATLGISLIAAEMRRHNWALMRFNSASRSAILFCWRICFSMSARLISRCAFRSPDVSGYFAENVFHPEWFAHVINRPKLQRQRLVSFRQTPGHENDWDRAQLGILFDSAANLEPVNIRQFNVGKNEVVVLFLGESQAVGSVRRRTSVKAAAFQDYQQKA